MEVRVCRDVMGQLSDQLVSMDELSVRLFSDTNRQTAIIYSSIGHLLRGHIGKGVASENLVFSQLLPLSEKSVVQGIPQEELAYSVRMLKSWGGKVVLTNESMCFFEVQNGKPVLALSTQSLKQIRGAYLAHEMGHVYHWNELKLKLQERGWKAEDAARFAADIINSPLGELVSEARANLAELNWLFENHKTVIDVEFTIKHYGNYPAERGINKALLFMEVLEGMRIPQNSFGITKVKIVLDLNEAITLATDLIIMNTVRDRQYAAAQYENLVSRAQRRGDKENQDRYAETLRRLTGEPQFPDDFIDPDNVFEGVKKQQNIDLFQTRFEARYRIWQERQQLLTPQGFDDFQAFGFERWDEAAQNTY